MMRSKNGILPAVALLIALASCDTVEPGAGSDGLLVDPAATAATRNLFANLQRLAPDYVLFGHQDALAYGIGWEGEQGRSDVHSVTGAYPAVYGWDIGHLEHGFRENLDGVVFNEMKGWIREGFARGGVITISWHMDNPVSGGSSWDTTAAVHAILPGGEKHGQYRMWLDRFAAFMNDLKMDGRLIPVIFRPFHEHTGGWFWWGAGHATDEEYVQLWRFTVDYLRDEKDVHNLLYAYSTDIFRDEAHYLERYPGDEFVDVLGFDDYWSFTDANRLPDIHRQMRTLVLMARQRGKLAALTETGWEGIPMSDWWTTRVLASLRQDPLTRGIAWILVWRNAHDRHYFAPYPGQASAEDFVRFYQDPMVLFEDELPDLYGPPSVSDEPSK